MIADPWVFASVGAAAFALMALGVWPLIAIIGPVIAHLILIQHSFGRQPDMGDTFLTSLSGLGWTGALAVAALGAFWERTSTGLALPFSGGARPVPIDRSIAISGSAAMLPLPVAVPLLLANSHSLDFLYWHLTLPIFGLSAAYLSIYFWRRHRTAISGRRPAPLMPQVLAPAASALAFVLVLVFLEFGQLEAALISAFIGIVAGLYARRRFPTETRPLREGTTAAGIAASVLVLVLITVILLSQYAAISGLSISVTRHLLLPQPPPLAIAYLAMLAAMLVFGWIAGPITTFVLAAVLIGPLFLISAEFRGGLTVLLIFATEAIRVGPQLHNPGFLRGSDPENPDLLGSWPYYIAAVLAAASPLLLI